MSKRKELKWIISISIAIGISVIAILGMSHLSSEKDQSNVGENLIEDEIFNKTMISNVNIELDEADFQDMLDNPLDEEYKEGTVTYNGNTIDYVGIRVKGNSSLRSVADTDSHRYSFKLKFDKYVDQNLNGYTKINLNNNYADPSYMREYLTYELLDSMELETPNYSYVNVSINDEPYGLYLAIENIEEHYLEQYFGNSTGNLYKADTGASLTWTEGMTVEETGLVLKSGSESNTQLLEFIEALNNGDDIESYFDVDKYLRYLAVSTVTANMDSYQGTFNHNYYLYEQDGKFTFLAWDHNMSIGGMGGQGDEQIEMLIDEPTVGNVENYPLVEYVLSDDHYKEQYHQYVQETLNLLTDLESEVDALKSLIGEAVKEDPTAFYSYDEFLANTGDESVDGYPGIVGFMKARIESVQKQLDGDIPSYVDGEGISGGMGGGNKSRDMPEMGEDYSPAGMPEMGDDDRPAERPGMEGGDSPADMPEDHKQGAPPDMNRSEMPSEMRGGTGTIIQEQVKELLIVIILLVLLMATLLFINHFQKYQGYNRSKKMKV